MGAISRWAVARPWAALLVWFILAASIVTGGITAGGKFNDSFELPDTDSLAAQKLLEELPGGQAAPSMASGKIVWRADQVTEPKVVNTIQRSLTQIAKIPHVQCITSPYGAPLGRACSDEVIAAYNQQLATIEASKAAQAGTELSPEEQQLLEAAKAQQKSIADLPESAQKALAGLGNAGQSADGTVAFATLTYDDNSAEFPEGAATLKETSDQIYKAIALLNAEPNLTAGMDSQALEQAGFAPPVSEIFGVIVALIILMVVFGSVVAGVLPIVASIISVMVGLMAVNLLARGIDVATFAPTLAAMIGLGVGIDYALFVISRFQQDIAAGHTPKQAALASVNTAGRAVVFAAFTVIIALLGLMVTGVNFFTGLALAASLTVLMMMIGATFVLPAFLSLAGMKTFAVPIPGLGNKVMQGHDSGIFTRYGTWLQRHYKWFGPIALTGLVICTIPVASLTLGFADASGREASDPGRVAYDLVSDGFAPGLNGPLVVALDASKKPGDNEAVQQVAAALQNVAGVAAAIAPPMAADQKVGVIQVIPTTGPQEQATVQLLENLRGTALPDAVGSTDLTGFIGGMTAITTDFTSVLVSALPAFLSVVIGLGFLMLLLLFRSVLIPLVGAVTSLLSLGAAMGVVVAVFQWGWLQNLLGVTQVGPIMPFLPVMVFAILFGLSMDYQVFLVSRMQEEWAQSKDNAWSIKAGLGSSGRVVAIAAAIMFSVFGAFIAEDDATIKMFGIALASAVLFDAFLVRLVIVPAVMFALGKHNWWLPGPLAKVLPTLTIEGSEPAPKDDAVADSHAPAATH